MYVDVTITTMRSRQQQLLIVKKCCTSRSQLPIVKTCWTSRSWLYNSNCPTDCNLFPFFGSKRFFHISFLYDP